MYGLGSMTWESVRL